MSPVTIRASGRVSSQDSASTGPIKQPSGLIADFSGDDENQLKAFDIHITHHEFQVVEPMLINYLRDHPRSWRAYQDLGYVRYRMHNTDASIEALSKSLTLNGGNPDAYKLRGLDLAFQHKYDLAQVDLERAARLNPESTEIHFSLGRIYLTRSLLFLAKHELNLAIQLDPKYTKAYQSLGLTMEALGDNAGALASYEKAVQIEDQQGGGSEWPYFDLAMYYSLQNDMEHSIVYFQKALEKNPRLDQAYFEIGKAYRSRREWQNAAEALRRAIEINSAVPEYHYVLSTIYRKLRDLKRSGEEAAIFRKLYYGPADAAQQTTLSPEDLQIPR